MVNTSDFQPEAWWFKPGLCCGVVSLDKKLCSTLPFSTQVYEWIPVTECWR